MDYDTLVLGGGSAGLAAATLLGRSRREVAVLDGGEPRNATAAHVHGVPSRDGSAPAELIAAGRAEVNAYGGTLIQDRACGIRRTGEHGFTVSRAGGGELTARAVLMATGLRDELPDVAGVRQQWGMDVLHCPYCHGYEVRDAPLGVLGGDNRTFTLHQASLVRQWSADVVFFPDRIVLNQTERERLTARGVRIVDGAVAGLTVRGGSLQGVRLADGREVPRSAVFLGPRFIPNDDLLIELGCETTDGGWVSVDNTGRTSVPGVWAAGNVVSEAAQLVNAASAGTIAAIAINHYLLAVDVELAVARHRSDPASGIGEHDGHVRPHVQA